MSQTQPIFSATLAAAFGLEAFRWRTLAGVVLAVVGAVVTIGGVDGIESSSGGGLGLLCGNFDLIIILLFSFGLFLARFFSSAPPHTRRCTVYCVQYCSNMLTGALFFKRLLFIDEVKPALRG